MRVRDLILTFIAMWVAISASAHSDSTYIRPQSVGLVLSGGGAKGIAHIGVIQALEDNDIPIDYITGTSMGAIVGSLYACGYTPHEMMELITSRDFMLWAKGEIDRRLSYYFLQDEPSPSIISLNIAEADSTRWKPQLPSSLISPLPMNMAFMELFAPYTLQSRGNFDNLFVPFRAIASDMTAKKPIVWSRGSLADAVRSSMSFPLVFHPLVIDGHLLYDGGIFDNFPVDVMSSTFAPEFMVGVNVANTDAASEKTSMINQLETMIMQHSDYSLPHRRGIKLRIHLEEYSLLDFDKARQIYQIGYDHAMQMMDSLKSRVTARIPAQARELRRDVFKSHTPALAFDSIEVKGGNKSQQQYLRRLFTANHTDTITVADVKDAYYRAISGNRYTNLIPEARYDDSTHRHILSLTQNIHDKINLGIGGYFTTATNSTLYLSAAYKTLAHRAFDIGFSGWLGQSYMAATLSAKMGLSSLNSSCLIVSALISRDKLFARQRKFFQTNSTNILTTNEYSGNVAYSWALGRNAKGAIEMGYGKTDRHFAFPDISSGRITDKLGNLKINYDYNTLDSWNLPFSGLRCQLSAEGYTGTTTTGTSTPLSKRSSRHWIQSTGDISWFNSINSRFSIGLDCHYLLSTRKLLPDYASSIIDAPEYTPIQCLSNIYSDRLRSYNYLAVGIMPVCKVTGIFQLRGKIDCFIPMRRIECNENHTARFGKWWGNPVWTGQCEGVLSLRFANLSAYAAYTTATQSRWHFGVSLGVFLKAR